jgi:hypothetical protein
MLEIEGRAMTTGNLEQLAAQLRYSGVEDVWFNLNQTGYAEWSPSGGLHLIYRVQGLEVPGNTKIANALNKETLAETRGEGGFVVVAPTGGNCHPNGQPWRTFSGRPSSWMWVDAAQRDAIFTSVRNAINQMPDRPVYEPKPVVQRTEGDLRPGDDFNNRANWSEILEPNGWTFHSQRGPETFWTRPGKHPRDGHSASSGYSADGDRLFVWSSGTDLDMECPLSKFHVYAHYNHNGDYAEATKALAADGFGTQTGFVRNDDFTMFFGPVTDDLKTDHVQAPRVLPNDDDWDPFGEDDDQPQRVIEVEDEQQPSRLRATFASQFKIYKVRWLWDKRIPMREITLVPGREGVGKSIFLAKLAADITNGTLPGEFFGTPKMVAYCASEDSWNQTVAPRLLAAGANLDMVYRVDVDPASGEMGAPVLPNDCDALATLMKSLNTGVLMLDPIVSLINGNLSTYKAPELRKALEPLRRCAEMANVAVIGLAHFNKSGAGDVSSQVAGSRAWLEVSRAAISIGRMDNEDRDDDDPTKFLKEPQYTCVVSQEKNNLGRTDLPNLTYVIEETFIDTDDEDGGQASVGVMRWTGETNVSVADLLAPTDRRRELGAAAKEVLAYVNEEWRERKMMTSVKELVEALDLTPANIRQILRRQLEAKKLESPSRGMYRPAQAIKATVVEEIASGSSTVAEADRPVLDGVQQQPDQDRGGSAFWGDAAGGAESDRGRRITSPDSGFGEPEWDPFDD